MDKITINNKEYLAKTLTYCEICGQQGKDNFYLVKSKLGGGNLVLECPNCDHEKTVAPEMITLDK
jgi:uncharacterized Zn finger protein